MNWSILPRGKKILVLSIGVVVLAVLLTVLSMANNAPNADDPTGGGTSNSLDNPPTLTQVTVKAVKGDQGLESFLDAILDADGDCSLNDNEDEGFASQTGPDGVGTMDLPDGQYVIRATPVDGSAEGSITAAVGTVIGAACAIPVPTANNEPIKINVGQ